MAGLQFKTWRMRAGEWFEGLYVFASDEARTEFQETFAAGAADVARLEADRQRAGPDRGVRHRRRRRGLGRLRRPARAPEPCRGYSVVALRRPLLLRGQQAVADRQQHGDQAVVLGDLAAELADRDGLLVPLGRVGDPVVPQRVVERHHAAGAQQPQRLLEVGAVLRLVAVAEDQVVVAVGQAGEYVERGAGDGAGALGGDAGLGERLLREPLVLGLDVDGGEHPVGAHAAQQPQAGHAGAGADLHDGSGVEHRGEEPQRRTAAGTDRDDPDLLRARPGGGEDVVLGDVRLGVGPTRGLDRRGDGGLLGGTRAESPAGVDERVDPIAQEPYAPREHGGPHGSLTGQGSQEPGGALTAFSQP